MGWRTGGILGRVGRRRWRRRAAACSVATAIGVGLRDALGDEGAPPPVVVEADAVPGRPERVILLILHPDIPEASLALVR